VLNCTGRTYIELTGETLNGTSFSATIKAPSLEDNSVGTP
jgi:hypothetical protein